MTWKGQYRKRWEWRTGSHTRKRLKPKQPKKK